MKLINDILIVKGKYGIKRVMALISFITVIVLTTYVVVKYESMALAALALLFGFLTTILGISEISKKFTDKSPKNKEDSE